MDLARAEELAGPVSKWPGNCYGIALALADEAGGEAAYGHYVGPIAPGTFFASRAGLGFVSHGWVKLPDGSVLDPTRWVFEGVEPYLYTGPLGEEYDPGGNILRAMMHGPPPDPDESAVDEQWGPMWPDSIFMMLGVDPMQLPPITYEQMRWLANAPLPLLGRHAAEVFGYMVEHDLGALIPIDNRRIVLGDD